MEIEEYDRQTLEYLTAAGVSAQLVERVNRLAAYKAYYKAEAAAWKQAADAAPLAGA